MRGCQVRTREHTGTKCIMYNGKTSFLGNLNQNSGSFEPARCEWEAGLPLTLSAKLHGHKLDSRISYMQLRLGAEINPLDLTCLEMSSCWLCLLSGYFLVSPSSCGCCTDPTLRVRRLLFKEWLYWLLSEKYLWQITKCADLSVLVNSVAYV